MFGDAICTIQVTRDYLESNIRAGDKLVHAGCCLTLMRSGPDGTLVRRLRPEDVPFDLRSAIPQSGLAPCRARRGPFPILGARGPGLELRPPLAH
jgi:hypothetical protein